MDEYNDYQTRPVMRGERIITALKKLSINSYPIISFYSNEDFGQNQPVAIITGLVRNNKGMPEEGVLISLCETGACAKSDQDGRFTLITQVTGSLHVGLLKDEYIPPAITHNIYIPPLHKGITIEVPDFITTALEKTGKSNTPK